MLLLCIQIPERGCSPAQAMYDFESKTLCCQEGLQSLAAFPKCTEEVYHNYFMHVVWLEVVRTWELDCRQGAYSSLLLPALTENGRLELFVCRLYFRNNSVRFLVAPITPLIAPCGLRLKPSRPSEWYSSSAVYEEGAQMGSGLDEGSRGLSLEANR